MLLRCDKRLAQSLCAQHRFSENLLTFSVVRRLLSDDGLVLVLGPAQIGDEALLHVLDLLHLPLQLSHEVLLLLGSGSLGLGEVLVYLQHLGPPGLGAVEQAE